MAAVLTDKIEMYKQYVFDVETVEDLAKLPTLERGGTDELAYITEPIKQGSTALVGSTSEVYRLNSSGVWAKFL